MKVRSFFIPIAATVLALLLAVLWIGWSMFGHSSSWPKDQQRLHFPRTADLVPSNALLTVHTFFDLKTLPNLADSVASSENRQETRERIDNLIYGLLAYVGLDIDDNLLDCQASDITFALFSSETNNNSLDWLLGISSFNQGDSSDFLENFLQKRNLLETDLVVDSYGDNEVISLKSEAMENDYQSFYLGQVDDDLVLMASSSNALRKSLDLLNQPDEQELEAAQTQRFVDQLGNGIALVKVSKSIFNQWIGLPVDFSQRDDIGDLIAGIKVADSDLIIEAYIPSETIPQQPENQLRDISGLLNASGGPAESVGLIGLSSQLLDEKHQLPLGELIRPILNELLIKEHPLFLRQLMNSVHGPLIWLKEPYGWVMGAYAPELNTSEINFLLNEQGWTQSEVNSDDHGFKIWTRFMIEQNEGNNYLDTQLAVALEEGDQFFWIGETLASLQQRKELKKGAIHWKELQKASQSGENSFDTLISLGPKLSIQNLYHWRPWVLMQALAGSSFSSSVQGLEIAIGPHRDEERFAIHIRARLSLG